MSITRRYLQHYAPRAAVYCLFTVLSVLFTMATALSVADFLKILFGEEAVGAAGSVPTGGNLIAQALSGVYLWLMGFGPRRALVWFSLLVLGLYGLKNVFTYCANVTLAVLRTKVVRDLRNDLFSKAMRLPLAYYDRHRQGDVLSRFSNDVVEYDESILGSLSALCTAAISIVLYLAMLLYLNVKLTLVVLVAIPVVAFVISGLSRSLKRKSKEVQERQAFLMSLIQETIEGLKVIKAYTAIDFCNSRFRAYNREYNRRRTRMFRRTYAASPVSDTLSNMVVILILLFGARLVFAHDAGLTPELFISFIMMFVLIIPHAKELANALSLMKKGAACEERLGEFLAEEADSALALRRLSAVAPARLSALAPERFSAVTFEHVSFAYAGGPEVLHNLSFRIPAGQTYALVGSSGSGKSTVADLLCGFYAPTRGRILIDDATTLGIVGQETLLFNDTAARNIAFMEEPDMERVEAAARLANAHDFISQLEKGYDTPLGDGGSLLSGGQRQRIAIARALYRDPSLLILDEATSALDTENERLVQQALNQASAGRTTLVIAHRLSTVVDADRILVLEGGRIVEQGTHQELLEGGGRYKQLVELQSLSTSRDGACPVSPATCETAPSALRRGMPRLYMLLFFLLPLLANGQRASATNHDNVFVRLSWEGITPPVTLARQFSFDNDFQDFAVAEGTSFDDTVRRCLCHDTIRYRLVSGEDTLFALTPFTDAAPTSMPAIEVCTVDSLSQRIHLRWSASPDPDIMGYVVCARDDDEAPWLAVDTLWNSSQTTLILPHIPLEEHYFRIYAFDSCLTASAMTEAVGNLLLSANANPLTGQVEASWSSYPCHQIDGAMGFDLELATFAQGESQPTTTYQHVGQNHLSFSVPQGTERARVTILAAYRQARSNTVELLFHIPPPSEPHDTVVPPPPPPVEQEKVWIPNAFTPEESTNNRFCLQTTGLRDYQLTLFDRFGRQIFHTEDPAACWDGRLPSGVAAMTGAYVYRLSYLDAYGSPQVITGTVLLIR